MDNSYICSGNMLCLKGNKQCLAFKPFEILTDHMFGTHNEILNNNELFKTLLLQCHMDVVQFT